MLLAAEADEALKEVRSCEFSRFSEASTSRGFHNDEMALWKREQNKNVPVHFGHGSLVLQPEYKMLRLRKKAVDVGVVASRRWLQSSCAMRSSFGMVRRNDARLAAVVQADGSRCQFYPRLRHPVASCGKSNDALEKLTRTFETCLYLMSERFCQAMYWRQPACCVWRLRALPCSMCASCAELNEVSGFCLFLLLPLCRLFASCSGPVVLGVIFSNFETTPFLWLPLASFGFLWICLLPLGSTIHSLPGCATLPERGPNNIHTYVACPAVIPCLNY